MNPWSKTSLSLWHLMVMIMMNGILLRRGGVRAFRTSSIQRASSHLLLQSQNAPIQEQRLQNPQHHSLFQTRLGSSWTDDNWTPEPRQTEDRRGGGGRSRQSRGGDSWGGGGGDDSYDNAPQRSSSWDRDGNRGDDRRRDYDNNNNRRGGGRGGRGGGRGRGGRGRGGRGDRNSFDRRDSKNDQQWRRDDRRKGRPEDNTPKIDMRGLETEGFVHLYGLAPVLSALKARQRDFSPREQREDTITDGNTVQSSGSDYFGRDDEEDKEDFNDLDPDFDAFQPAPAAATKVARKPEAQFTPYLFLQDRSMGSNSGRSGEKMAAAAEVKQLAEEIGLPVHYTDKGHLNALSGSRPHQGLVLRCGALEFEPLSRIPVPDANNPSASPNLWLVLDEVVDPQNLGALLRSSYFLGGNNNQRMGILVCAKNSAPPSPVVSASSAGALELLNVYSTSSLPKTLGMAREDGFRIIGAASAKPRGVGGGDDDDDDGAGLYDLQNLPPSDGQPTLLVLGSEGHGLRTLVAKLCTDFVRIPRGDGSDGEDADANNDDRVVDSLNVSVTGGILLWHLLYGNK